jgi:hypothetical protein
MKSEPSQMTTTTIANNQVFKNSDQKLPWYRFRTRSLDTKRVFLDTGRAEVIFSMICAPDLNTDERLAEFIGAAFGASNGDPAVLRLAIEAFSDWPGLDALVRKSERLWKSFEKRAPNFDCTATLRRIVSEQPPFGEPPSHSDRT